MRGKKTKFLKDKVNNNAAYFSPLAWQHTKWSKQLSNIQSRTRNCEYLTTSKTIDLTCIHFDVNVHEHNLISVHHQKEKSS